MVISAVLFDMDGLIFDTEKLYKKSWQYAAREQNLQIDDQEYNAFIGVQDRICEQILKDLFRDKLDLARFKEVRDKHFQNSRSNGIKFKDGFEYLFDFLEKNNIKRALVTSSHLLDIKTNFANTKYLDRFDAIVSADDVEMSKPDPECYLLTCKRLNILPNQAVVLEDSNNGMKAGITAGCKTIMIPDLLQPIKEVAHRANYIVASLNNVVLILSKFTV